MVRCGMQNHNKGKGVRLSRYDVWQDGGHLDLFNGLDKQAAGSERPLPVHLFMHLEWRSILKAERASCTETGHIHAVMYSAHVRVRVCVHDRTYMCMFLCVCMCVCIRVCVRAYVRVVCVCVGYRFLTSPCSVDGGVLCLTIRT